MTRSTNPFPLSYELEMPTSNQAFDSQLETWKREMGMPWNRIRLKVEISNLLRHVGQYPVSPGISSRRSPGC
jgi:hypothetical protein